MGRFVQDGLDRHEVAVEASSPDLHGLIRYAWVPELGSGDRMIRRIEVETWCHHHVKKPLLYDLGVADREMEGQLTDGISHIRCD